MKKLVLFITTIFCLSTTTYAQTQYTSETDVYKVSKVFFYGYDFSDYKLSDDKRIGQNLKRYLSSLTSFLMSHISERKLAEWIKKDTVLHDFNPTMIVNNNIKNEDIATAVKHTINKDSLQILVNRYSINEKSGIGHVIIFECFDSPSKRVSAYSVFFDIMTKKILKTIYTSHRDGNSYNRIADWNSAAFLTIKELCDMYLLDLKTYKKTVKAQK